MDCKRLQVYPKGQAMDQVSSGAYYSLIVRHLLQTFSVRASERWKEGRKVIYSKDATVTLHIRVSYRGASVRTLHLGACPHLTPIPHCSRRSLCCSARTFRELNLKLLTAGALTIFTAIHVSMMYLATPATLTTTQNPHSFLLPVFVTYVATLRLDHLLLFQRVLAVL